VDINPPISPGERVFSIIGGDKKNAFVRLKRISISLEGCYRLADKFFHKRDINFSTELNVPMTARVSMRARLIFFDGGVECLARTQKINGGHVTSIVRPSIIYIVERRDRAREKGG